MQWDLFCRVIDNFGDIGVCWRLAADLAGRGEQVRLWTDDASALAWMAPDGASGVTVRSWPGDEEGILPGDVVIEAFGCDPPPGFVQRMAARAPPPRWINLEYLSAESFVDRSHGLASPVAAGAGAGLAKRFFYPGFTKRSGGLIREPDLVERRRRFDPAAWLHTLGLERGDGEQLVSLFCYEQPALPRLLESLAQTPTLLLATDGHAARQVAQWLGPQMSRGALRALTLPRLSQRDYDHLLWACDLNFVRGEDSFVRAQWAAAPFVWQIYAQPELAHLKKLRAFLDRFLATAPAGVANELRRFWAGWNGAAPPAGAPMRLDTWRRHAEAWRAHLWTQPDLVTTLIASAAQAS